MTKAASFREIGDRSQVRLAVVYSCIEVQQSKDLEANFEFAEGHCSRWARRISCHIVAYIRDDDSVGPVNPPGLQRLAELLEQREIDFVLAYSPEWVSLSPDQFQGFLSLLDEAGASLEFVAEHTNAIGGTREC